MKNIKIACRSALIAAVFAVASISSVAHAAGPKDADSITIVYKGNLSESITFTKVDGGEEWEAVEEGSDTSTSWDFVRLSYQLLVLENQEDGKKYRFYLSDNEGKITVERSKVDGYRTYAKGNWTVYSWGKGGAMTHIESQMVDF